jgi:uncharacterized protein YchJ
MLFAEKSTVYCKNHKTYTHNTKKFNIYDVRASSTKANLRERATAYLLTQQRTHLRATLHTLCYCLPGRYTMKLGRWVPQVAWQMGTKAFVEPAALIFRNVFYIIQTLKLFKKHIQMD